MKRLAYVIVSAWLLAGADRDLAAQARPAQEMAAGDIRIEMGRPVRLRLEVQDAAPLWQAASRLVHALAPATSFQPGAAATAVIEPSVEWLDPLVGARQLKVTSSVVEVSVPPGPERTATYSILWRAPDGAFELRVPSAPASFKAEIVRPQPAIVVEATGSMEGVLLGDQVPVRVRIVEPGGARAVMLHHRAVPSGAVSTRPIAYESAPMECAESSPANSLWTGTIPRPQDKNSTIDYYIEIVDPSSRRSTYGTSDLPHRIRLLEPQEASGQ